MELRDNDDPFFWDVARVVQELCTSNRSWNAPPATKLPDPDQLTARLIELELDGEALLTYEGTLGSLKDLLVDELGIKKVPQRISIQKAIKEFQARSAEYKRWKSANSGDQAHDSELDEKPKLERRQSTDVLVGGQETAAGASSATAGVPFASDDQLSPSLAPKARRSPFVSRQASPDTVFTPTEQPSLAKRDLGPSTPGDHSGLPPKKKQRIAPTILSTVPSRNSFNFIPTEADILVGAEPTIGSRAADDSPSSPYLGSRGFTFGHTLNPAMSSDEEDSPGHFSFVQRGTDYPGRRLQVNKAMKRYLLRHSTHPVSSTVSVGSSDEVLPLFGESEDEYDEETWKEYEQEEAEREELEALKKTFLSKDVIDQVIQEAIKSYEEEWNQKKKPKELLKANKLWHDARRHNSRQRLISDAAGWCRSLDARINKLSQEFQGQQWASLRELKKHMEHFELSVGQRQAQRLRIQVLTSPVEPPKPRKLPSLAIRKKQPVRREIDEDVLTSDSDDGLDQFIIDDGVKQAPAEESDPFMLESAGKSMEQDHVYGQETRPNVSLRAGEPMDIDQGLGAHADGTGAPHSLQGTDETAPSDGVSAVSGTQYTGQMSPVGEAVEHDPALIADIDTTLRSQSPSGSGRPLHPEMDSTSASAPGVGDAPNTPEISHHPNAEEISTLAKLGVSYWMEKDRNPMGLLIAVLWKWPTDFRASLDMALHESGRNETESLWEICVCELETRIKKGGQVEASDMITKIAIGLAQLYISWVEHSNFAYPLRLSLDRNHRKKLEQLHEPQQFRKFCRQLRRVLRGFRKIEGPVTDGEESGQDDGLRANIDLPAQAPLPSETAREKHDMGESEEEDVEEDSEEDMPISPSRASRASRTRKRKRRIVRNTEAADMRETNFQHQALFESRRLRLREGLAEVLPKDMTRFIINETKEDDEELIYINPRTRGSIKDHQIEGVRFMWNQIVVKSKVRQGCLLAHTMGLGKTMQVVTLLVAIAEAALSKNKAVYKQVPKELRESRTLILCPSGLVDNWIDELNIWTPLRGPEDRPLADNEVGFLGRVYKVEAALAQSQRVACVSAWQASGGVLVMGYPIFLKLSKDPQLLEMLSETPNMVIADEAHKLKSSTSQIHQVTQNFRAASRIAMTGSPLTNNVADYYHMVSWVAPNYLGPYSEFKQVYEAPVLGLHTDSSATEKRRAVKTLNILRETVSPLVHRMGILSLKDDLPQKKEFILYLSLTPLQRAAYSAYLQRIVYNSAVRERLSKGMTSIWTFINDLAVLLAHPSIYKRRLKRQKAERIALPNRSGDTTPTLPSLDEAAESASASISADITSELLATVSRRDLENVSHSWKVVILRAILDECRRIGDKVLVFSQQIATLDFLEEMFRREKRNWYRLDGNTHSTERQASVKRFNEDDKAEVYLISTKAGGEGLNIHGANRVVIFDFKYVPMEEQQAVGRAYRIGQAKPVFVYWLIVADTFEESVQNRSVFKLQLASRVVDKRNPLSWSKRALDLFPKDGRLPSVPPKDPGVPAYSGQDVVLDALLDSPKMGDSIRRIIMTETFEEEEPDDSILTTDDRKEISEAVAMNHQRGATGWAAGPAYTAEQQRLLLGGVAALPSASVPQPFGLANTGRESHFPPQQIHSIAQTQQLTEPRLVKTIVPERTISSQAVLIPPIAASGAPRNNAISPTDGAFQSAQSTEPSNTSARPNPANMPADRTDQPTSASQSVSGDPAATPAHAPRLVTNVAPIPGTGTVFASPGAGSQSVEEQRVGASHAGQHSAPKDQALLRAVAVKKRRLEDMLWKVRGELSDDLATRTISPSDFVTALDAGLLGHQQYPEDILLMDFYTSLVRTLEKSPRFSKAILLGLVAAEELSHMKREERSDLVRKYDDLDESTFQRKLSDTIQVTSVRTR